jgi:RHS repeat-associated protein
VSYAYDDDGNLVQKVEPDGRRWQYDWNGHGHLRAVTRGDGKRVEFEYDAFARRTKKVAFDGGAHVEMERVFVWDGNHVVHELDSQEGLTTWHWVPGSDSPTSKEASGKRWSVASDHLGAPTELHDEVGALAWKMQLDVYGVASYEEGTSTDCPWRWPGQYEDEETGLYYNRYRYYDPKRGDYLSQDPIRLNGALGLYGYVEDPTGWVDPWGLAQAPCGKKAAVAKTTSQNAAELARNLAREGRSVALGEAAGHIVPSTGTQGHWAAGARSRGLLARYGIGINDAANGIPIGHPRPHNEMHTRGFLAGVESRLNAVESRMLGEAYGRKAIRSALRRELRSIGREVLE